MADLTIQISTPVLISGQYFKVEYSTDGVNYTLYGNEDNDPFVVSGLTEGVLYYFRYTLVRSTSPFIDCDPVIKTFRIPETEPCVTATGEINLAGDIYELVLTFTLPSPYVNPCGGFRLEYGVSPNLTSVYIPTFITSPSINPMTLPASNDTYTVKIYSIDCNGNETLCDELEVSPDPVSCEHAAITSAVINESGGLYSLVLTVQPSIPATNIYVLKYYQANFVSTGVPDQGGTVYLSGTGSNPEIFTIPVNPNLNITGPNITYVGAITDDCKWNSRFDVSILLD